MGAKITSSMFAQIREMHAQGLHDTEIAQALGVPQPRVWDVRSRVLGLRPNPKTRRAEELKRYEVYDKHTTEYVCEGTAREIAARLGFALKTVYSMVSTTRAGNPNGRYEVYAIEEDE